MIRAFMVAAAITSMGSVGKNYDGSNPKLEEVIAATWPVELVDEALDVAWCESRGKPAARNGQYMGIFQMGRREWAKFGKGSPYDPIANSQAAYRYFKVAGWKPWECQPISA